MSLVSNSEAYGQSETLISSIRNIIKDYPSESIFKEFLQNADDAGATRFRIIIDSRSHPTGSLITNKMKAWQGPAILFFNNAEFKSADFKSLMQIRIGGKQKDYTKIGKHGLGFNSCYHFTDAPSFLSGNSIAFLDPQEKFLPTKSGRGMICTLPKEGICKFSEKDQLAPFVGIEGINSNSKFFKGTLFRIPLRQQKSDISDQIFSIDDVIELFKRIKLNFASYFLFLRNIEEIGVSHIPKNASSAFNAKFLWKATVSGLDEDVRNKRKNIVNGEIQIFLMNIELVDDDSNKKNDQWIIATSSQKDLENAELKSYAKEHRLSVLGGAAALIKSENNEDDDQNYVIGHFRRLRDNQDFFRGTTVFKSSKFPWEEVEDRDFVGRLFSFLPLPDTTSLPFHLNGNWAQSSDRARLLLEKDNDMPDLDHQKLDWNRHILLEFLPEVYCKLLEEILKLQNSRKIDLQNRCISKFWPFPPSTQNYSKSIISFGCKVLQRVLKCNDIFQLITPDYHYSHGDRVTFTNVNINVDNLFKCLSFKQIEDFRQLLRNNWKELKEIGIKRDYRLKSVIRLLPIWPTRQNPPSPNHKSILAPISIGYLFPSHFNMYRTKSDTVFLKYSDNLDCKILQNLDVPVRDMHSYAFNDVEYPEEYDDDYVKYLDSLLSQGSGKIVEDLKDHKRFPCAFTKELKLIADLYDYNNIVFRVVFGGDSDNFLDLSLIKYSTMLAKIGFNKEIDQNTFIKCAEKVEELQGMDEPPSDIRYRGFVLVDHLYKNIDKSEFKGIDRIPFVPIAKHLDKHYNKYYDHPQVLDCLNNIIHPEYKEIAWSQKPLIAEDVIPPDNVLRKYPSFGKPNVSNAIKHLRFLCTTIINDDEWKRDWKETFVFNVFKVYEWLDNKCSSENINLKPHINSNDTLFLNCDNNQDPFNVTNWTSVANMVLNTEPGEKRYVNARLAKYRKMLKCSGVREIEIPNYNIQIGKYDHTSIYKSMLEFLTRQENFFHDVVFVVNGEEIWASQYVLAASSKFFNRKFRSEIYTDSSTINPARIHISNASSNSIHILLHYLYGQNIDEAIRKYHNFNGNRQSNLELYKDLMEVANDYDIDHLKNLMELKLSRLVNRTNMREIENLASDLYASQLKEYCRLYIQKNTDLYDAFT